MLELKEEFQKLIPKYFGFLERECNLTFKGFEFIKGYAFFYQAIYINEFLCILISLDEREGYMDIRLKCKNSDDVFLLDRLLEKVDPECKVGLRITKKRISQYRRIFKKYSHEDDLEERVSLFVFDGTDLNSLL